MDCGIRYTDLFVYTKLASENTSKKKKFLDNKIDVKVMPFLVYI